jgi:hypothetical protein
VLSVLLVWIAATRIFYVVLHDPVLGFGNQYDMGRTAACLDLWPDLPGGARDVASFDAPIPKYRVQKISSQRCYPSAEVVLDHVAIRLDGIRRYFTGDALVDMRAIGLLKALLLVIAACVAQQALAADPRVAFLHAATFMLVMADPVLTLYLNTLYGEFVAAFGAYAAVAGMAAMTMHGRWTAATLGLCIGGATFLAFSRMQHVLLPLFFIAVLIAAVRVVPQAASLGPRWLRHKATGAVCVAIAIVSTCAIAVNSTFLKATPIFHEVNRNNMLFGAVLPAAKNPEALIAALGLPRECAALVHSDFFRKASRGQSGACPEALSIAPARLLSAFASEPSAMLSVVGRGILLSSAWRMPYVGEVAGAVLQRVAIGPLGVTASVESIGLLMGFTGHVIFWVVPVVVGLFAGFGLAARSRPAEVTARIVLVSLSAIIVSAWATALLGDGYSELARHVHLGIVAAHAAWVMLIGAALQTCANGTRPRRHQWISGTLMVSTCIGLVALLTHAPVAFGRLVEPAGDDKLATHDAFSGFFIAPYRVVAVEMAQQGRVLARTTTLPATTLARYHPLNSGRNAFDYTFDAAAIASKIVAGKPISIYAIDDANARELVDIRHWCIAGIPCQ